MRAPCAFRRRARGARDIGEREAWWGVDSRSHRQTHHGNERHRPGAAWAISGATPPGAQKADANARKSFDQPCCRTSSVARSLGGSPQVLVRPQPARSQVTVRQPMPAPAQSRKAAGSCGPDEGPYGAKLDRSCATQRRSIKLTTHMERYRPKTEPSARYRLNCTSRWTFSALALMGRRKAQALWCHFPPARV